MRTITPEKFKKASKSKKDLAKLYHSWRTFQISDHLLLRVELKTDFANNYLASVLRGKKASAAARKKAEDASPVETPPPIANGAETTSPATGKQKRARSRWVQRLQQ